MLALCAVSAAMQNMNGLKEGKARSVMNWMSKNKVKVRKVLNTLWGKFAENLKCLNLRGVEKCKLFQKAEDTRYA